MIKYPWRRGSRDERRNWSTHGSVDPSKCHFLQIHLKACQMWDDEHSVFSFLQEMIGNDSHSTQVQRNDTQSFSFNHHLFVPQETKRSSRYTFYVSAVTLTVLCRHILICIFKRKRKLKRSREDQEPWPEALVLLPNRRGGLFVWREQL